MADNDTNVERKRPDLLTMLLGVITLLISAYVLTDGEIWVPMVDLRWIIAGGAVLVGLLLLGASVRGNNRKRG
ncbi:MAG: hypothetical protein M3548_02555 [Actinomycetota bacterium]|nr:hypothetical protein [Actinomycetota bacterium]